MTARLLSAIGATDYMAAVVRVGDLDGDGGDELLFAQSDPCTRDVTCLTATDLWGKVLWQTGRPSRDNTYVYSDLAVQIYDWDADGRNEVLWVEQAIYAESIVWDYSQNKHITVPTTRRGELRGRRGWAQEGARRYEENAILHVLDGATGREKSSIAIPAPADDCLGFANLTGGPRRGDLIVKDRYWNLWGVAHDGRVLWHWNAGNPGHYPLIEDVNDDGLDEVFIGYALLASDGKVLWRNADLPHMDTACAVRSGGRTRLVVSHGEGPPIHGGVRCLDVSGKELWHREHGHAQYVVGGRFRTDLPGPQFAVADIGWADPAGRLRPALCLYDGDGGELLRREYPTNTSLAIKRIRWRGDGPDCLALIVGRFDSAAQAFTSQPVLILDGYGDVIDELPAVLPDGRPGGAVTNLVPADVWGDSREEALLGGAEHFNIYTNAALWPRPHLYNATSYSGR